MFFAKTGLCTFCHFGTGLSLVILINLGFRQKPKFLKISVGFVKFSKWYQSSKKPKWQDTQKSKKSRIAKVTELTKLQFLSVKRILTLVTPCTVIYLVVLNELLLYCIFICMSNCVLIEHLAECERFKYFSKCKVVKLKIKSVPSSFFELPFLYLPNVFIHEPNEFIHVRKLKPTLKIQILYSLVQ